LTDNTGRAVADRPALRRCVAVAPETFAQEHWGRTALLSDATELPRDFSDLLTLDAVDELLSRRGLRTPFLRMAKSGNVIPTARFTRPGGAGAEIGDQVADDRVLALFADGATIVLQGLHRLWPPVIDFAGQLTTDLGHPVQVNAYITPPQSQGFSSHHDVHDVFVLQVAGTKRWRIHEPVHELPLRDQPWTDFRGAVAAAAESEPVIDTVLEPGDALYLPRGYLHAAQALGGVSAHLTVGVHAVTRYALVEALTTLAADDAALRRSLPLGLDLSDPGMVAAELAEVVSALNRRLAAADPADVTARLRDSTWSRSRPAPVAPIATATAAVAATEHTGVRLRPGLRGRIEESDGTAYLVLPDRRLALPAGTAPAVASLLEGKPWRAGDLAPALPADSAVQLTRLLLREGVAVLEAA
jgi:lysine-specific demethylase/histidyl-hydroxylase NO66